MTSSTLATHPAERTTARTRARTALVDALARRSRSATAVRAEAAGRRALVRAERAQRRAVDLRRGAGTAGPRTLRAGGPRD